LILILLGLFLLEGTVIKWLLPDAWQSHVYVVPHFVLVVILFIGLYMNRHYALVYGMIFGLLQDIVYYEHALGLYAFTIGLTGYMAGLVARWFPFRGLSAVAMIVCGSLLYELLLYGLYRYLLNVVSVDIGWTFMYKMLPSLLFNLGFALLIYIPIGKLLEQIANDREPEDHIE
jgi:rod shape-determining protein MreD